MGIIALEGLRFYAPHGVYEEEALTGNEFIVDVRIQTDLSKAGKEDQLSATINYETIYHIVDIAMRERADLVETLLHRITAGLKKQFSTMESLKVTIRKVKPIPNASMLWSLVEEEQSYKQQCSKCNGPLICYKSPECWCHQVDSVPPATREWLSTQYKKCLCPKCLALYNG